MSKIVELAVMLQVLCVSVYCTESSPIENMGFQTQESSECNKPLFGTKQNLINLGDAVASLKSRYVVLSKQINDFQQSGSIDGDVVTDELFDTIPDLCTRILVRIDILSKKYECFHQFLNQTVEKISDFQMDKNLHRLIGFSSSVKMSAFDAAICAVHDSANAVNTACIDIDDVLEKLSESLSLMKNKTPTLNSLSAAVGSFLQVNQKVNIFQNMNGHQYLRKQSVNR